MTPAPAHQQILDTPAGAANVSAADTGDEIAHLIAAAERTAEMPLAAFEAIADLLTYLSERDAGADA